MLIQCDYKVMLFRLYFRRFAIFFSNITIPIQKILRFYAYLLKNILRFYAYLPKNILRFQKKVVSLQRI